VVEAANNMQSHATSNVCNVAQAAALAAVSGPLDAVATMRETFDRRRRTIHRLLSEAPGVVCLLPDGAFYVYPSLHRALGRTIRGRTPTTSAQLCQLVLEEVGVAIVPGEAFGTPGYARLSYALGDKELTEGIERISSLLAEAVD